MKRKVTKEAILTMIDELDTRCAKLSLSQKDRIIHNGISELMTIVQPFTQSLSYPLDTRYENGEIRFVINIPEDVTDVYDLYLESENNDNIFFEHGIREWRETDLIWRDSQDKTIVHVNLRNPRENVRYSAAVINYFYIPGPNFDEFFIGSDIYIALEFAIASAAYTLVHDVEKAGQNRSAFTRAASAIVNPYPEDYDDNKKLSMFPLGY